MEGLPAIAASLLVPFTYPGNRTWWVALVAAAVVIGVHHMVKTRDLVALPAAIFPREVYTHRSNLLDIQLVLGRQILGVLFGGTAIGSSWLLATHLSRWLDRTFGAPELDFPPLAASLLFTVTLFVVWDASRFVVHYAAHKIPALWALHQVHHSAEVMTPLTFHRVHPLESVIFQLRGALVTGLLGGGFFWLFRGAAADITLLGVHGLGLICNVAHGNLRHTHVWLRFPPALERWLISPAQHQIHHSIDPADYESNYGTWLSIWDRMAGSLRISTETPVAQFGISSDIRNHGNDLISAWIGPVIGLGRSLLPTVILLIAVSANAQETEDDYDESIIVYGDDGTPRVTGSAQVIEAEELELYNADDFHKVLQGATGTYVRDEDGFGLRPNIGIRGANSDRSAKVTLLEDGIPLAPAPYAAPAAYYFPMSTRLIGVEIFKGPAAVQHGPQTIGGTINLLTRRIPKKADGGADIAYGLRNASKIHAWAGTKGVLIEGVRAATAGFKELDNGGPTGFERSELMAKLGAGDFELKLGYANEASHETYLGLHVDDYADDPYRRYVASSLGFMRWRRTQVELAWNTDFGETFRARTVAYHHYLTRAWTKLDQFAGGPDLHTLLQQPEGGQSAVFLAILRGEEDSVSDDQNLLIGTNDRDFHSGGLQHRGRWSANHGAEVSSALEYGVRLHLDRVHRVQTQDPHAMTSGELVRTDGERIRYLNSRAEATALAAHIQEDLGIGPVHLVPGLRSETIWTRMELKGEDSQPGVVRTIGLPAIGMLVDVATGIDVLGGVYRGFSPVPPGQSEDVEPERAWNWEGGVRLGGASQTSAEVVAFASDYDNLVGQCTISGGCSSAQLDQQFNGGSVAIWGVEGLFDQEFLLPKGLALPISVSWTLTESAFRTGFVSSFPQFGTVEAGDALPYVPEHQGSARLGLEHSRFRFGISASYRSGMHDVADSGEPAIPSLLTLDAATEWQATRHLALYGTGSNLTGSTALVSWRPFGARPTAPLQVMLGLKLTPQ